MTSEKIQKKKMVRFSSFYVCLLMLSKFISAQSYRLYQWQTQNGSLQKLVIFNVQYRKELYLSEVASVPYDSKAESDCEIIESIDSAAVYSPQPTIIAGLSYVLFAEQQNQTVAKGSGVISLIDGKGDIYIEENQVFEIIVAPQNSTDSSEGYLFLGHQNSVCQISEHEYSSEPKCLKISKFTKEMCLQNQCAQVTPRSVFESKALLGLTFYEVQMEGDKLSLDGFFENRSENEAAFDMEVHLKALENSQSSFSSVSEGIKMEEFQTSSSVDTSQLQITKKIIQVSDLTAYSAENVHSIPLIKKLKFKQVNQPEKTEYLHFQPFQRRTYQLRMSQVSSDSSADSQAVSFSQNKEASESENTAFFRVYNLDGVLEYDDTSSVQSDSLIENESDQTEANNLRTQGLQQVNQTESRSSSLFAIIGGTGGGLGLIVILGVLYCCRKKIHARIIGDKKSDHEDSTRPSTDNPQSKKTQRLNSKRKSKDIAQESQVKICDFVGTDFSDPSVPRTPFSKNSRRKVGKPRINNPEKEEQQRRDAGDSGRPMVRQFNLERDQTELSAELNRAYDHMKSSGYSTSAGSMKSSFQTPGKKDLVEVREQSEQQRQKAKHAECEAEKPSYCRNLTFNKDSQSSVDDDFYDPEDQIQSKSVVKKNSDEISNSQLQRTLKTARNGCQDSLPNVSKVTQKEFGGQERESVIFLPISSSIQNKGTESKNKNFSSADESQISVEESDIPRFRKSPNDQKYEEV